MSTAATNVRKSKDRSLFWRLCTNPTGGVSLFIIVVFIAWAVAPGFFSAFDPNRADFAQGALGPSTAHWLGTDDIGRDILSRVIWASQASMAAAAESIGIAVVLGCGLGILGGYLGKGWDTFGNWISNMLMTFPVMVVLLTATALVGPDMPKIMAVFGVLLIPAFYRLGFVIVRSARSELYVDAARVSGLGDLRIMWRHILPVVRAPLIIQAGFLSAVGITMHSALLFLGVGDASVPSWGVMLQEAYSKILLTPSGMIVPVVVLATIMLSLVLFSTTLRDELQQSRRTPGRRRRAPQPVIDSATQTIIVHSETHAGAPVLEISELAIGYPRNDGSTSVVVSNSTLTVDHGEVVGLVGESGSGKTQTAFAVLGVLGKGGKVLKGSIKFKGRELVGLDKDEYAALRGSGIAYIPQEPMSGLDPSFTIGSQLVEPLRRVRGMSKKAARTHAIGMLAKVGMPDPEKTFNSYPHEVSGGQAQRVLIAGALSLKPDLIIADEPTTALDVTVQAEILDLMRGLQKETGVAILLVTHNFGVVADLCDRVAIMQTGRIVEVGAATEIFGGAIHGYTKELLGAILDESMPARGEYSEPGTGAHDAPSIVEFRGIDVTYHGKRTGKQSFRALKGVSLGIRPGETVGLVGESGSGKTTLGRALLGLAPVTAGEVVFEGANIAHASRADRKEIAKHLQVVFQDPYTSLNPQMNIGQILAEPLLAQGVKPADAQKRVRELLDSVALPVDSMDRRPREFSGGQRQRIAIARALALDPKVIVCDEPVSALDLSTSARVLDLFLEIQQRTGVAYLFISHDLAVVRHVSHRVAVMYGGEIVEWGDGDQVTSHPTQAYTRKLMMANPLADPARQAERRAQRLALSASN